MKKRLGNMALLVIAAVMLSLFTLTASAAEPQVTTEGNQTTLTVTEAGEKQVTLKITEKEEQKIVFVDQQKAENGTAKFITTLEEGQYVARFYIEEQAAYQELSFEVGGEVPSSSSETPSSSSSSSSEAPSPSSENESGQSSTQPTGSSQAAQVSSEPSGNGSHTGDQPIFPVLAVLVLAAAVAMVVIHKRTGEKNV